MIMICVGCFVPYEEYCHPCTAQIESLPGPSQMMASERYKIVIELCRIAGHGVDTELCNKKIVELCSCSAFTAATEGSIQLADMARANRRP